MEMVTCRVLVIQIPQRINTSICSDSVYFIVEVLGFIGYAHCALQMADDEHILIILRHVFRFRRICSLFYLWVVRSGAFICVIGMNRLRRNAFMNKSSVSPLIFQT